MNASTNSALPVDDKKKEKDFSPAADKVDTRTKEMPMGLLIIEDEKRDPLAALPPG